MARAPLDKLRKYQAARGWTVPWYSSHGSDFNHDFRATLDKDRPQLEYNYRSQPNYPHRGPDLSGDVGSQLLPARRQTIYHTYSTYARGTDILGNAYWWAWTSPRWSGRKTGRSPRGERRGGTARTRPSPTEVPRLADHPPSLCQARATVRE